MAHGIQTVTDAGVEIIEAMYNRKPAWHKLGKVWMPSETRRTQDEGIPAGTDDGRVTWWQMMAGVV